MCYLNSIKHRLLSNNIVPNTSITALISVPTNSPSLYSFSFDKHIVSPSKSVHNIGIVFDFYLCFSSRIDKITKAIAYK